MGKLSAFLHPALAEEREVVVSERFRDEKGAVVPFKVKALTQEETDAITKAATRRVKENGQTRERLDSVDFSRRMVVAATVEPDFRDKELCEAYGVVDPLLLPGKMLLSGEYGKLMQAITDLSGFGGEEQEVKN